MYKSPIDVIQGEMQMQLEGEILRAVQNVGVCVDKEELLKALAYDRNQYEKGYTDGYAEAIDKFADRLKEKCYEIAETFRDMCFLTVEAIDISIFEIAEQLKEGGQDD